MSTRRLGPLPLAVLTTLFLCVAVTAQTPRGRLEISRSPGSEGRTLVPTGRIPLELRVWLAPEWIDGDLDNGELVQPFRQPLDLPVQLTVPFTDVASVTTHEVGIGAEPPRACVLNGRTVRAVRDETLDTDRLQAFRIPMEISIAVAGAVRIGAPSLEFVYADEFREEFFSGVQPVERKTYRTSGQPLALTIVELPRVGRPSSFTGAIGRFELQATADGSVILAPGETLRIVVELSGSGNFGAFKGPRLERPQDFQILGRVDRQDGDLLRTTLELEPLHREATEVRLAFDAFDPDLSRYVTLTADAIELKLSDSFPEAPAERNEDSEDNASAFDRLIETIDPDRPLRAHSRDPNATKRSTSAESNRLGGLMLALGAIAIFAFRWVRPTAQSETRSLWRRRARAIRTSSATASLRRELRAMHDDLERRPDSTDEHLGAELETALRQLDQKLFGHSEDQTATPSIDRERFVEACQRLASQERIDVSEVTVRDERRRRQNWDRVVTAALTVMLLLSAVLSSFDRPGTTPRPDNEITKWFEVAADRYLASRPAEAHWLWLRAKDRSEDSRIDHNLALLRREWSLPSAGEDAGSTVLEGSVRKASTITLGLWLLAFAGLARLVSITRRRRGPAADWLFHTVLGAVVIAGSIYLVTRAEPERTTTAVVFAPVLALHSEPTESAELGSSLRLAQEVEVLDWSDRWARVRRDGRELFVRRGGLLLVRGYESAGNGQDVGPERRLEQRLLGGTRDQ